MICEDEEFAQEKLGIEIAKKFTSRLADMMAAKCVTDIPTGAPKEVLYEGEPAYQVNIIPPHYLIFRSVHEHPPLNNEGQLDWHHVSRVQIINIQ